MKNPGPLLRKYFPEIYFFLVKFKNGLNRLISPYSIYITDSLGGSFKKYMAEPDFMNRVEELKKNLDPDSVVTVDVIMKRLAYYPDESLKRRISKRDRIAGGLLEVETGKKSDEIENCIKEAARKYGFLAKRAEESVFCYFHGLTFLPPEVLNYIAGSDFIDIGAFVGDSAIALSQYNYRKIFSIEISLKSIAKYRANMARSGIDNDRFEIIHAAIVSDDRGEPVRLADTGSAGFSLLRNRSKYDEISIEQRSADYIVDKYNISPRYIKVDIEGSALDFAKGAIKTLTAFRPVVSIAVYHNPVEFFEVKPFLERHLSSYKFIIRKLSAGVRNNLCHSDVFLIGYPSEAAAGKEN